jgi:GNAT superfamily N-acetyltransferase
MLSRLPPLPDFLPGRLLMECGSTRDYRQLSRFHYAPGDPATFAGIWRISYLDRGGSRVVAVAVLSFPVPSCLERRAALRLSGSRADELRFANQHIRTISRVIVHPQFRALGLSTRLIERLCASCETRYVEAMAVMGQVHPLFERAGMKRFEPARQDVRRPVYFLFDRRAQNQKESE